ncbi:MAG: M20/M25/M40 family metallo-hydrolase [Algoriphagus sp.]|uniref:M20/M25/M40 family metallo-hydrolase n=1 Tax=Algoriphagus sp. TaxID=1872435 RepID=UPI0017921697|nr:M20/M25/M40 family metallo-hydrolase [Algoriphagus sp.]NVJ86350.1 M20/M25/M40 family metallo-hydrolase [Algoriphagus sp.]
MKKLLLFLFLIPAFSWAQSHKEKIQTIFNLELTQGHTYENLRYLCKEIGHRLSGSPQAAAAVEYTRQLMESYGFDTVYLQPVMVPHWVRGGKDEVKIVNSEKLGTVDLHALALGNTQGTGPSGLLGEVVEVQGLDGLQALGEGARGKIVFYNQPMDPTKVNTFQAYSGAVGQRGSGAAEAAKFGAVGVIVRSMSNRIDEIPHTGNQRYNPEYTEIPSLAISTKDAELLSDLLEEQSDLKVFLKSEGEMKGEVLSYNVIGEIRGTEKPEEIIAVGGHLDSWDVGEGAHDDGAGCIQAIEVLRIYKELGWKPKRTIRAVMWMNEENGLMGGREYARVAKEKGEKHIAAIESDAGGFLPLGFSSSGTDAQRSKLVSWKDLFTPYNIWKFDVPGGGADIGPLRDQGPILIGLHPDSQRYFIYHHTPADVFEAVDQRELELGAAAMTALVYLIEQEGI